MLVLFCTSNLKEKLIEKVGLVVTPLLSYHVFIVRIDANSLIKQWRKFGQSIVLGVEG
jgi:branched-subunit amino acid permease